MGLKLNDQITELPFVGDSYARKLEKLEIRTIKDIIEYVPHRYLDFSKVSKISEIKMGETITVSGTITSFANQFTRRGMAMQIVNIEDSTGKLTVIFFNQLYLSRVFRPGIKISLGGKLDFFGKKRAMISPEYEIIPESGKRVHTGGIIPIYPETAGLSSKWLRKRISDAFEETKSEIKEFLPKEVVVKNNLLDYLRSIKAIHFPKSLDEAEAGKKRLAFNEFLYLHLANIKRKKEWQKHDVSQKLEFLPAEIENFISSLPFELTNSQKQSIDEILNDIKGDTPMNRILEGDVGSGKTAVAATAAFAAFASRTQSIFMAPTQILAQQHFNTLNKIFEKYKARIALITSEKKDLNVGSTDIFVGTHALIHDKVSFERVSLVVIDEQHRFGVEQRTHLVSKAKGKSLVPHVLTMTATPIPRTVALTLFGDLELSTLKDMPKGRQKVTTWVVPPAKRDSGYDWVASLIKKEKVQAFVVCPLIEESEKETMVEVKAATAEFERIKKLYPALKVALLHGKMKAKEKDKVISDFRKGKTQILVSTPVIEVGVDIPNAAVMVIEAADRFGLAQLHQLRGRVGRGIKKSYCLLMSESTGKKAISRLSAMTRTFSGFELSELDLKLRGPGEIFGSSQSGFPALKVGDWSDIELIKLTKTVADTYSPLLLRLVTVKY